MKLEYKFLKAKFKMGSKLKKKLKPKQAQSIEEIESIIGKEIPQIKDYVTSMVVGGKIEGSNIVELGLHQCGLINLPTSIGNLTSLRKLYIEFNKLNTLPQSISNLQSLEQLQLNSNKFATIPESISTLQSLKELYMNNNNITNLPDSIKNLKMLKVLSLYNNKIAFLPENVGDLSNLQKLDLWDNQLSSLPQSILKLQSLQTLDLSGNNLKELPDAIASLSSLTELKINNNELNSLPESFSQLQRLKHLELENNNWTGEWADIAKKDISTILKLCRKLNGMYVFISHAWADQDKYQIVKLKDLLEQGCIKRENNLNLNIIHDVIICEEDVVDDIWNFMTEFVPKSHILLFIATNNSITSEACGYELFLANKFDLEILPIKGDDLNWDELTKIALLDRNLQYQGNLDLSNPKERFEFGKPPLVDMLINYLITHESQIKKSKKDYELEIEETKKNIISIINSEEFRELIKLNFESVKSVFQELNN
ncbi:MAG: leucine-rich repeat domain-containing protein, partial [Candidatus Lokiarchaeota archaeon]